MAKNNTSSLTLMIHISVIAVSALLVACTKIPAAQQANYEGNVAYYSQRYDDALAKYERSLAFAEQSGDEQYAAIAMFGLARTYAQLCQKESAEKWFKQSISAREALPDVRHAHMTQNLLEYGRFLASCSRKSEAVMLYDRAVPLLESMGIEEDDSLGYAFVLDEYEALLRPAGRMSDASAAATRAKLLREEYMERTPQFEPEPYPNCNILN